MSKTLDTFPRPQKEAVAHATAPFLLLHHPRQMVQAGVGNQFFGELGCFQEVPGQGQVPYIVPDMGVAARNDPDLILPAQL